MDAALSSATAAPLAGSARLAQAAEIHCAHCGLPCPPEPPRDGARSFCCAGCRTVFRILTDNGLERFYAIEGTPGVRPPEPDSSAAYAVLDEPAVRARIVDFSNGETTRVTLHMPAMHCAACVWLLEHLYRIIPGSGRSEVNFPRRELVVFIDEKVLPLSQLAAKLAQLGYPPELRLQALASAKTPPTNRRLLIQLGVAGFAFGNIMMLSFASYFGLNAFFEPVLKHWFGWISLLLATPVLLFSARDFYRNAWLGIAQGTLTIDTPLALGISALFIQSAAEILGGAGEGYLDSFSGLVFLLLCGRWFQRRTYDALSFDRDYRSYFPLSVTRLAAGHAQPAPLDTLRPGDRIIIRHGDIIPADAVLISGEARLDYSFVTGESTPAPVSAGERVYAGGKQTGGALEVELVKEVSRSYLTSLWDSPAFRKPREHYTKNLTDRAGRWFTAAVVIIALATLLFWWQRDPTIMVRAFTSVLIVACPCALALAAPFTFSTAQSLLGRAGMFLRNPSVVEALARTNAVVFDKTGTLTSKRHEEVRYEGEALSEQEKAAIASVCRQSSHPVSGAIAAAVSGTSRAAEPVRHFYETAGLGLEGQAGDLTIRIGSAAFLGLDPAGRPGTWVAINAQLRGSFSMQHADREGLASMIGQIKDTGATVAILSGDNPREAGRYQDLLGPEAEIRFNASPREKLEYIGLHQKAGRCVTMIGDGLNDAGALRQSDAGIAVTDDIGTFSPACDAILDAKAFHRLPEFLGFARRTLSVLRAAFGISLLYNFIGLAYAASGNLSPLVSAVLMPLSSFSVIGFSLVATSWAGRRAGLRA